MTEVLSCYIHDINQELENYMEKANADAVYEAMCYSLLGTGKRIRPVMVLGFCSLCGAQEKTALPFACAVEMIHTYSLIHDDLPCMDNDILRRGRATNHIVYGEAIALLAGDALLTKAFEIALGAADVEPRNVIRAVKLMARMAGADGMVGGQCIDLTLRPEETSLETVEAMDIGKTVSLISAACQMGCIAADASQSLQNSADIYAHNLGLAFQIRDDVLGVIGNTRELGKTVGIDQKNGRQNYVAMLGVDRAQRLAEEYTEKAITQLHKFPGDTDFLHKLTLSMSERTV